MDKLDLGRLDLKTAGPAPAKGSTVQRSANPLGVGFTHAGTNDDGENSAAVRVTAQRFLSAP